MSYDESSSPVESSEITEFPYDITNNKSNCEFVNVGTGPSGRDMVYLNLEEQDAKFGFEEFAIAVQNRGSFTDERGQVTNTMVYQSYDKQNGNVKTKYNIKLRGEQFSNIAERIKTELKRKAEDYSNMDMTQEKFPFSVYTGVEDVKEVYLNGQKYNFGLFLEAYNTRKVERGGISYIRYQSSEKDKYGRTPAPKYIKINDQQDFMIGQAFKNSVE